MKLYFRVSWDILLAAIWGYLAICLPTSYAQSSSGDSEISEVRITALDGIVQVLPHGAEHNWISTQTNQPLYANDRVRTQPNSRVWLEWSDKTVVKFGPSSELEILPPHQAGASSGLRLIDGILSFFHRDKPGRIRIITKGAMAGIEGTEFVMEVLPVNGSEQTVLSVIDGKVRFENELAALVLTNGEQAIAEPGKAPARTAGFVANNILQWAFYYPAVLDLNDLPLTADEQNALSESLAAYRAGDLLGALAKYPSDRRPASNPERVYHAALLLSVGEVDKAASELLDVPAGDRVSPLAAALRQLIAAVKRQPRYTTSGPASATECLANSYYAQSEASGEESLREALRLARLAVERSPEFGFGWTRIAELEFSFGHNDAAAAALDKSLALTPRNAQALALKGFLLAGQNHTRRAIEWFDRAIAADSALGNAWLGRGLCRIRIGDARGGREDLLVAAALEPQRAELRSYLGKSFGDAGEFGRATKELELAKGLDPHDPTAWLYSALLNQQNNRINDAVRDLEHSQALNENRSIYRSQLLLDQDQAVRSANLAAVYQDAGMTDVAAREAARAVNYDYANYSAHLFLANSYRGFSDSDLINRRYETPALNEFLLANLLAPVSAGMISPTISQQEYSRLFERNRLGVVSDTTYLSRGAWLESGAQYGIYDNFSYSLEGFYRTDPGERVNDDVEQRQLALALKYEVTPQDSIYVQVVHFEGESGDLVQYYDPSTANPGIRVKETQEPIVGLGYHHEWNPGVHTLFFAARLIDTLSVTNPLGPTILASRPGDPTPVLDSLNLIRFNQDFENELEIYSAELQQIWQQTAGSTIVGGRVQYGNIQAENVQSNVSPATFGGFFDPTTNAAQQDMTWDFKRFSVYGYQQWQLCDSFRLIGGLSYDWLQFPKNFQYAPVSRGEKTMDQLSPKAGFIWTPAAGSMVRFAYAQAVSGMSFDQSFQLEPSQVAGVIQSYRSIIPESVAGPNPGARFETFGLSLEQKLGSGTYLGMAGELLGSTVHRTVGAFDSLDAFNYSIPSELRQHLNYDEQSLLFTVNQLLGDMWSVGARYRLSRAVLKANYADVPNTLPFVGPDSIAPTERLEGVLHQVSLFGILNHPCGFFSKGEALWYSQDNRGYSPGLPGDDFWQFNVFAGYRFPRRRAELAVGLLNITDQDYRLNPLNLYGNLPRGRTLAVNLRLNF